MKKVGKHDDKTPDMFDASAADSNVDVADGFADDVKQSKPSSAKRPDKQSVSQYWQVRLHPFERYRGYGKKKSTETEALTYVTWLMDKSAREGNSIVLENGGVVWTLWTFENGAWTEELNH